MKNDRVTNLGDIDPTQVDLASAPKPKRRRRKVQPMPKLLEPWVEKAKARMEKRPASPGIMMEPGAGCDEFVPMSPHDNDEAWQYQIHDAFGTRSPSTVRVFIEQLRSLCGQVWDEGRRGWRPSETEISAAVNFVNSVQPRDEAEAALAAQMLAVHFMTMRLSAQAMMTGDTRTAATAAKLARTYTMQMDALNRGRGKSRSTRQHITVKHEKHVHTHKHQHIDARGCALPLPTPSRTIGDHHAGQLEHRAEVLCPGKPLQGKDPVGAVVPITSRKWKASL
jgi:hypothetical protein